MTTTSLSGKVALITGGSRGLGAAGARRLAEAGADVAITFRKSADAADALVGECTALGVRAAAFQADQGEPDQVAGMVDAVASHFGAIDILVNNAAIFSVGAMGTVPLADVARMWAINVQGTVLTTQAAVAHMPDGGRVINIGSVAGERASTAGFADYSATKAAVAMYGRAWAHELAPRAITVNTVVVSFAQTDMVIPADSDAGRYVLGLLPLHRYAKPDEVAAAVVFLAGPQASFMTGGSIHVDGGWNA